jgi:acyl-phosphate glycerol 3-phosphate acyltransferase
MSAFIWLSVTAVVSYLVGAIPFGYVVARLRGVDISTAGSGNIGATNVGRVLGRKYGVLVFVLDFAKGALPVLAARRLPESGADVPAEWLAVAAGLAAFLGHVFPVYLGFHGGKGVATGAGVVAVLVPWAALVAAVAWIAVVLSSRFGSAASVIAAVVLAGFQILFTPQPWSGPRLLVTLFCALAALLVVVRHRGNLRRLASGTEHHLKENPAMLLLGKVLHVLSVGLWFGTVVFFTLAGVLIFDAFGKEAAKPDTGAKTPGAQDQRPVWFPVPPEMNKEPPGPKFPNPLRLEQGTRAAGLAVSPLFPWYYGIQIVCALVATLTAVGWCLSLGKGPLLRTRAVVLAVALLTVAAGWWLEGVVSALRVPRNDLTDQVLISASPSPEEIQAAEKARADFGMWHGFSLIQNFATLLLVTIAMAMAANLPARVDSRQPGARDAADATDRKVASGDLVRQAPAG